MSKTHPEGKTVEEIWEEVCAKDPSKKKPEEACDACSDPGEESGSDVDPEELLSECAKAIFDCFVASEVEDNMDIDDIMELSDEILSVLANKIYAKVLDRYPDRVPDEEDKPACPPKASKRGGCKDCGAPCRMEFDYCRECYYKH